MPISRYVHVWLRKKVLVKRDFSGTSFSRECQMQMLSPITAWIPSRTIQTTIVHVRQRTDHRYYDVSQIDRHKPRSQSHRNTGRARAREANSQSNPILVLSPPLFPIPSVMACILRPVILAVLFHPSNKAGIKTGSPDYSPETVGAVAVKLPALM